mgnify:CR=1 FL=1
MTQFIQQQKQQVKRILLRHSKPSRCDYFLVGFQKCSTSSLWSSLRHHNWVKPGVTKELGFWIENNNSENLNPTDYRMLFPLRKGGKNSLMPLLIISQPLDVWRKSLITIRKQSLSSFCGTPLKEHSLHGKCFTWSLRTRSTRAIKIGIGALFKWLWMKNWVRTKCRKTHLDLINIWGQVCLHKC